jgi:hypothetical protein
VTSLDRWSSIEALAKAQVRAEVLAEYAAEPLQVGQAVAWGECTDFGLTDGLSLQHRAMTPELTFCDERIPEPQLRAPRGLKLPLCRYCEKAYAASADIKPPSLAPREVA